MSLLPPNSTTFEHHVCDVTSQATQLPIKIKTLTKIDQAPSQFLAHLAWQNSVDRWQRNWTELEKRSQIKASFSIHKRKGTISALRDIVQGFGFTLRVVEWFQTNPMGQAGTFSIIIETRGKILTEESYNTLVALIQDAKPLTRYLLGIELNIIPVRGKSYRQCATYSAEESIIFPKQEQPQFKLNALTALMVGDDVTILPQQKQPEFQLKTAFRHTTIDDVTIYPKFELSPQFGYFRMQIFLHEDTMIFPRETA